MPSRAIVPALVALVVVVGLVHTRVKRGRRLLVLRSQRSALRRALSVVFLAVAALGLVASATSVTGPWDSLSSLSIILFSGTDDKLHAAATIAARCAPPPTATDTMSLSNDPDRRLRRKPHW